MFTSWQVAPGPEKGSWGWRLLVLCTPCAGSLLGRAKRGASVVPQEGYRSSASLEEAVLRAYGKEILISDGERRPLDIEEERLTELLPGVTWKHYKGTSCLSRCRERDF